MSAEIFIVVGTVVLLSAWLPLLLRNGPLSLPMIAVGVGLALAPISPVDNPLTAYGGVVEHVTEVVLLSAIYGAGLKVDRPFGWRAWGSTWRLLFLVMPLSILLIATLAMGLVGLPLGAAILLGAMLAPTDPVLASDLQLGPPGKGEEGEARFGLTTEAGLNDGLAMPFVVLGITLMEANLTDLGGLAGWFGLEMVWRPLGGALVGIAIGIGLVKVNRVLPERWRLHVTNSGLVGLALAFITYGLCELAGVNGFVAVFCEAVAVRNVTEGTAYAQRLAHAASQIERAVMVFVMMFFGFALAHGLLQSTRIELVLFAATVLLVIRPLSTWVSFLGSRCDRRTRQALSYFGIRGIGSIYYAAYAVSRLSPNAGDVVITAMALTVLASVVIYGVSSPFAIARLIKPSART